MDFSGSYNGLSWGPGTGFVVTGWDGIDDMPAIRDTDAVRSGEHGAFRGIDFLNARTLTLALTLIPQWALSGTPTYAQIVAQYDAMVQQVANAFLPQPADLPLIFAGGTRQLNCRPKKRAIPRGLDRLSTSGIATLELVAVDPRIYDSTQQILTAGLPTSTGLGTGFPMAFNMGFGGAVTGGFLTAVNGGTFATRPVVTIRGPVDNPLIQNLTTGQSLKLGNLSLTSTDTLTIDFDAHSILLNGTASRRSSMTASSQWWELAPGTNQLRWTSDNYYAAAQISVAFRSAWM